MQQPDRDVGTVPDARSGPPVRGHRSLVIVPVWGTDFIDCAFVGLCNGLEQEKNIRFLQDNDIRLAFITTDDANAREIERRCRQLRHFEYSVHVLKDSGRPADHSYVTMRACTDHGIELAIANGRNAIFANADIIFSDGFLAHLHDWLSRGYDAVSLLALRAVKEEFYGITKNEKGFDFSRGSLVDFALANLHPISETHFWQDGRASPAIHFWWGPRRKLLVARAFHLHPMIVKHAVLRPGLDQTIDHEYLQECIDDKERIKIIHDTNDMIVVELSSRHYEYPQDITLLTRDQNVRWAKVWTNKLHRHYFRSSIFFGATTEEAMSEGAAIETAADELYPDLYAFFDNLRFDRMQAYHHVEYAKAACRAGFARGEIVTTLTVLVPTLLGALLRRSALVRWTNRGLKKTLPGPVYRSIRFGIAPRARTYLSALADGIRSRRA